MTKSLLLKSNFKLLLAHLHITVLLFGVCHRRL